MIKVVIILRTVRGLHFREDSTGYAGVYCAGLRRVTLTPPVHGNRARPIYCFNLVLVGSAKHLIAR